MINKLLAYEEGFRAKPYHCTEGYATIGIGTKIGPKLASLDMYQFTVTKKVAEAFLEEELRSIMEKLIKHRWYTDLDEDRQVIIKSMAYQMGYSGLINFKKMIAALEKKQWTEASLQALDSRWAKQTPARAKRHANVLAGSKIKDVYEGKL